MDRLSVAAASRDVGKKGVNRRLRIGGQIPAILYGHGQEPVGLVLQSKEFTQLMKGTGGTNALIDLKVDTSGDAIVVMVKDYQVNFISHKITHVDLFKIDMKKKVLVKVALQAVGKSIGTTKGGLVEMVRREIELRCLPDNIPAKVEVDITELDLGYSLHAKELKLPEGVELPPGEDFAVVSIVAPREEVVAEVAAPVEGAAVAGAEGAAAPAAGAAAAPAADAKADKGKGDKK
jgi:large subunit ribosomal protein L25